MAARVNKKFSIKSAGFIFLCHIAAALFLFKRGAYCHAFFWASAVMLSISIPYLYAITLKKKFIAYEGIYLYLAGIAIHYMAIFYLPLNQFGELGYDPEILSTVMTAVVIGVASFLIGYWTNLGRGIARSLPVNNFIFPHEKLPKIPVKLYFIGWALRGIFMIIPSLGKFGGWQIVGMVMNNSVGMALMVDAYLAFSGNALNISSGKRRMHLIRTAIFLSIEVINGFLSGFSGAQLAPIILVIIAYIKATKKVPVVPIVAVVLLFAFFVVPFTKTFREKRWKGDTIENSIDYAVGEFSDEEKVAEKRVGSVNRISNPLEMAMVCYEKREEGIMVKTYENIFDLLAMFIPRFIWPNKPSADFNKVGKELGILGEDDNFTSVGMTMIASFIMSGGIINVAIGMFFVGMIIRILWEWLMVRSGENILAFLIYFQMINNWIKDEEFFIELHSGIAFLIYAYFLIGLINKKRKNPPMHSM